MMELDAGIRSQKLGRFQGILQKKGRKDCEAVREWNTPQVKEMAHSINVPGLLRAHSDQTNNQGACMSLIKVVCLCVMVL